MTEQPQRSSDRLARAIIRNLHEVGSARLERLAITGMDQAETTHSVDFFTVADMALFNDMIAHSIKVFDRNSASTSFWYVRRCKQTVVDAALQAAGSSVQFLESVADKLKQIRDLTHFHIDRDRVGHHREVWEQAGLRNDELASALNAAWEALRAVHRGHLSKEFEYPDYDGSDIAPILRQASKEGLLYKPRS